MMQTTPPSRAQRLVALLRAHRVPIGIDIGDDAIRAAVSRNGAWQFEIVPLPAGALVRGIVQDAAACIEALRTMHERIAPGRTRSTVHAIVTLSSATLYSQTFALPQLAMNDLQKAIDLNMQMNSPIPLSELASGWQLLETSGQQLNVLTASVRHDTAAGITTVLATAGFVVVALEAKSLSVARALRTVMEGFNNEGAYLVVDLDAVGLSIITIERGMLAFEYATAWRDVQPEGGSLALDALTTVLVRQLAQVVNYHRQHSQVPLTAALLLTPSLQNDLVPVIAQATNLPVQPVAIGSPAVDSSWIPVLGSALRGSGSAADDVEINLLGRTAREQFQRENVLNFLGFWRIAVPAALAVPLLATLGVFLFVRHTAVLLEQQTAGLRQDAHVTELTTLEARAATFNQTVGALTAIQASLRPKAPLMTTIIEQAGANGVQIRRLSVVAAPSASTITGIAGSEERVLAFKKILQADARIHDVALPIADIRSGPEGISFSMTFQSDFAAAGKTAP